MRGLDVSSGLPLAQAFWRQDNCLKTVCFYCHLMVTNKNNTCSDKRRTGKVREKLGQVSEHKRDGKNSNVISQPSDSLRSDSLGALDAPELLRITGRI